MRKLKEMLPDDVFQNQNLRELMLEVSSLHACEFTRELYDILFKLYLILKENQSSKI